MDPPPPLEPRTPERPTGEVSDERILRFEKPGSFMKFEDDNISGYFTVGDVYTVYRRLDPHEAELEPDIQMEYEAENVRCLNTNAGGFVRFQNTVDRSLYQVPTLVSHWPPKFPGRPDNEYYYFKPLRGRPPSPLIETNKKLRFGDETLGGKCRRKRSKRKSTRRRIRKRSKTAHKKRKFF
jgi:hypothetical protein